LRIDGLHILERIYCPISCK